MTELKAHCDNRSFEKSVHLLAISPIKKVFWTEFGQSSSSALFFKNALSGKMSVNLGEDQILGGGRPSFLLKYESRYKAEIEKIVFDQAD